MPMLEEKQDQDSAVEVVSSRRQRRQMGVALVILLAALVLVMVKDRQFWFPASPASSDLAEPPRPAKTNAQPAETKAEAPSPAKSKARSGPAAAPAPPAPASSGASIVASNRAVLPPLEVEVVTSGQRQSARPKNNAVKVDMQEAAAPSSPTPTVTSRTPVGETQSASDVTTNASATVRLSPETAQVVTKSVEPSYPLLAKQMKVQGAVVLQALIGQEGNIEDLRVLSGPAILSTAAMEAVRQWRFRPYYYQGRAVETEARITVNFTISTY